MLVKGETSCNRTACQVEFKLPRWWNTSTRKWYCHGCAMRINRACEQFGDPQLCFEENSEGFNKLTGFDKP